MIYLMYQPAFWWIYWQQIAYEDFGYLVTKSNTVCAYGSIAAKHANGKPFPP